MTKIEGKRSRRRLTWAVLVGACCLPGCVARETTPAVEESRTSSSAEMVKYHNASARTCNLDSVSADQLAQRWGIAPLGIQRSAAGYMLDFRYRVTDPEKARPFLDRRVKPYLVDQAGRRLVIPVSAKVGPLRQITEEPRCDRVYFMLFGNPGRTIQDGDRVTLMVFDTEAAEFTVGAASLADQEKASF